MTRGKAQPKQTRKLLHLQKSYFFSSPEVFKLHLHLVLFHTIKSDAPKARTVTNPRLDQAEHALILSNGRLCVFSSLSLLFKFSVSEPPPHSIPLQTHRSRLLYDTFPPQPPKETKINNSEVAA